ncbi:MAG: hypothetical protein QOI38_2477 [Sphingomonadales bacterium]|jgi:hypothetical protein|nr:hypothetical protein [Sphingomonadales bacterium]
MSSFPSKMGRGTTRRVVAGYWLGLVRHPSTMLRMVPLPTAARQGGIRL